MSEGARDVLRLVGYWIRSVEDLTYVPPHELVGDPGAVDYERIARYLEAGASFEGYRGRSWCRFGCACDMGHRELYDGVWVWPQGLAHYVRVHRVRLPAELEARAQTADSSLDVKAPQHYRVDRTFWTAWCGTARSGEFRTLLAAARERVAERREQQYASAARALQEREGVGEHGCHIAGCTRTALSQRYLCAECIVRRDLPETVCAPSVDELHRLLNRSGGV